MLAERMKQSVLLVALGGLGLVSCEKKEEATVPLAAIAEEVALVVPAETAPPVAKATSSERAAVLFSENNPIHFADNV